MNVQRIYALQRALNELSRPFIRMKADILNCVIPAYRMGTDGVCTVIYPPLTVSALDQVDALWEQAKSEFLRREQI